MHVYAASDNPGYASVKTPPPPTPCVPHAEKSSCSHYRSSGHTPQSRWLHPLSSLYDAHKTQLGPAALHGSNAYYRQWNRHAIKGSINSLPLALYCPGSSFQEDSPLVTLDIS